MKTNSMRREERVVVFTDIHNFTAAARAAGEDSLPALLQEVYEEVGSIVVEHGGAVMKYLGDGMLCVFEARGADGAVAAAAAARQAYARLAEKRGLGGHTELEVGISCGQVAVGVLGHRSLRCAEVLGEVVNEAAAIGHHRGIALTGRVRERLAGDRPTRRLADVPLKWREEPLEVWEVIEPGEQARPAERPVIRPEASPPDGLRRREIVLIGPVRAGKSTLGALLAERLQLPRCPMDDVRFGYYAEIGYDEAFADRVGEAAGFWPVYMYWKEFECHAVERLVTEHHDCVIDFGAGHSVYENDNHLQRAAAALAPFDNVVLLLPCADEDECCRILRERWPEEPGQVTLDLNEHFVRHPANRRLASIVVYTAGKTPEETRDEILERVSL